MKRRKKTRKIYVGPVAVGGHAPISVQSMTSTDTRNVSSTMSQIRRLERAGCEIVRVAVPDDAAAEALKQIVRRASVPIVADIHFNYRLALKSMEAGVGGIRINPGNIGGKQRVEEVVRAARRHGVPIRIGVNGGSLERDILKKYGHPNAEALVESALRNIALLESMDFDQIKVSIKSTDFQTTVSAYRMLSRKVRTPLHIGVTEAGTAFSGSIKSALAMGVLLEGGIGDTLRVSLSADPVEEVRVGFEILKQMGIRKVGPELISCPTCGRRQLDVVRLAGQVEKKMAGMKRSFRVAVMGCEVNGPGEAKAADVGVAGSKNIGVMFKKGKIIKRCPKDRLLAELMKEIIRMESGEG